MATQPNCEIQMSEAAAIRVVYRSHAMKEVARLMDVPVDTARTWIYRHFSTARRRELARALIAEMDAQDVERDAVRRQLAEWAAER